MQFREHLDMVARGGCQAPGCDHDHSEGLDLAQRCHVGAGSKITHYEDGKVSVVCARCLRPIVDIAGPVTQRDRVILAECHPAAPVVASYVGGSGKLKIACFQCRKPVTELEVRAGTFGVVDAKNAPRPDAKLAELPLESFIGHHVKKAFQEPGLPIEHMWVRITGIVDGRLTGVLDNDPQYCEAIKHGDQVLVDRNEVEAVQ